MFGIGLTKASLGLGSSVILLSMSQLPRIPFQMQTLEQQMTPILDYKLGQVLFPKWTFLPFNISLFP